ncbi:hypothetical protein [Micromonospora sp. NPDC051141]|uniref:hypothetical protein n=1 Tax=Micromonospora sp. NPDC051141 TaxID=3364284 RepID=UPI00378DAC80
MQRAKEREAAGEVATRQASLADLSAYQRQVLHGLSDDLEAVLLLMASVVYEKDNKNREFLATSVLTWLKHYPSTPAVLAYQEFRADYGSAPSEVLGVMLMCAESALDGGPLASEELRDRWSLVSATHLRK